MQDNLIQQHTSSTTIIEKEPETVQIVVSDPHLVDDHTEYTVTLTSNLKAHGLEGYPLVVQKRFNDFADLYTKVQGILGTSDAKLLPEFPGRVWWGALSDEVVSDRNEKFNYFMKFIAKDPVLRVHREIDEFFGITRTSTILQRAMKTTS